MLVIHQRTLFSSSLAGAGYTQLCAMRCGAPFPAQPAQLVEPFAPSHPHALHRHRASQAIIHVDPSCVLMLDGFPKAQHHALVVAREPGLDSILQLTSAHLPLLAHMRAVALAWVEQLQAGAGSSQPLAAEAVSEAQRRSNRATRTSGDAAAGPSAGEGAQQVADEPVPAGWRLGFHSVPSMRQLHLHVISQDFDSPALKNKKHWNSFTTAFFKDLDAVVSEVNAHGSVRVDRAAAEQLLKAPLRCHRCGCMLGTTPQLKAHIVQCGQQ